MPASTSWRRKSRSRKKRSRLTRPRSRIFVRSSKRRTKNRQRSPTRRNRMWGFNKKNQNERPGSIDFDSAAARVTAADPLIAEAAAATAIEEDADEALIIKQEWSIVAVKGACYPAARHLHPAYAVDNDESEQITPKMQCF